MQLICTTAIKIKIQNQIGMVWPRGALKTEIGAATVLFVYIV
jgi:hypothetical protein